MKRIVLASALAATLSVALAAATFAQGGPPPGPGGPGQRPMAFGTVQSVDVSARSITLNGPRGTHTIYVASDAKIVGEKTISASDLKVGDRIQVRGRPAVISADSITAGGPGDDAMAPMGPPPGAGGGGGFGPPPGGPRFGDGGGPGFGPPGMPGRMGNPDGIVVEVGKVTTLKPLTISFGGSRTLTVELNDSTKVQTIGDVKLADIKKGDRIAAQVRPQSDGSMAAERVAVNLPMPPGPAGFGMGRPGQGGFGPGGPGFGPGGPGFGQGPAGAGPGFGPGGPGFGPGPGGPGFGPQDDQGPPQDMPPGPGGDLNPGGPAPDDATPDGPPPADDGGGPSSGT